MVILTVFKEAAGSGIKRQTRNFNTVNDAVRYGQISGLYYEVFDTLTGRCIDWEEVNMTISDGWYYDETELIWKKYREEELCMA